MTLTKEFNPIDKFETASSTEARTTETKRERERERDRERQRESLSSVFAVMLRTVSLLPHYYCLHPQSIFQFDFQCYTIDCHAHTPLFPFCGCSRSRQQEICIYQLKLAIILIPLKLFSSLSPHFCFQMEIYFAVICASN